MKIELIGEKTITISEHESILNASLAAGIPHFHACGGNGKCSTCRIIIFEGSENVSPITEREAKMKNMFSLPEKVRLACQTKVTGNDVKIERIFKDEKDLVHYRHSQDIHHLNQMLGVEKELVLFFLDIRDFTSFTNTHLPFDVIYVVRRFFIMLNDVVEKHKGEIIESAGDGCYVVFGLKSSVKQAAENALKCSFSFASELKKFNTHYLNKYFNVAFEAGIGIHVGKVVVGQVHIGKKSNRSVMGLPVNIASRLQAATRKLGNSIVVSEDFLNLTSFKNEAPSQSIQLKGISEAYVVKLIGQPFNK
jgi:adenylate cyclase